MAYNAAIKRKYNFKSNDVPKCNFGNERNIGVPIMSILDAVTLITPGVAIAGFVLAIINTWMQIEVNRVKLLVEPHLYMARDGKSAIGVNVINLSAIPITLRDVGITALDSNGCLKSYSGYPALSSPSFGTVPRIVSAKPVDEKLPKRLQPRESFFVPLDHCRGPNLNPLKCYAKTACLKEFYGKGPALNKFKELMESGE